MAMGIVSTARTSDSLICSAILRFSFRRVAQSCLRNRCERALKNKLFCSWFAGASAPRFFRAFRAFTDAADDRLHQAIYALLFVAVHFLEAKFRLALRTFANAHRQLAAESIFDEGRLVALLLQVPGIDAKRRKIARLAFGPAGRCDEVLGSVTCRIADAVQFEPGNWANVCGRGAIADRIWQIELDKACDDPPGDGQGLVARRRRCCFRSARRRIAGRTRGQASN